MSGAGPPLARGTLDEDDRLHSWKEIAAYLKHGERTVRRWEANEGMPVHRHVHDKRGSVYAYRSELDRWRERRTQPGMSSAPAAELERTPRRGRRWSVFLAAALASMAAAMLLRPQPGRPATADLAPVPLTTYPGNELDPALSPDGDEIAFTWNGIRQENYDIYRRPIADDRPVRLTTDPADDISPAWSADGRTIAFLRPLGNRVAVLALPAADGPERKLAEFFFEPNTFIKFRARFLAWHPKLRQLVVAARASADEPHALWTVDGSGSIRRLTMPPKSWFGDVSPAFAGDGQALLFSRGETRFSGEVYRLPLGRDGLPAGEPEPVARGMAWADSPVALEAKQVIFHWRSRRGLWRMPFPEFREPIQLGFAGWEAESPAFSSRRQRLVYASGGSDVNIWRIDFTARQSSYRAARVIESTHFDSSPAISPDGSRIAFYSSRSGRNELWASDMDGQNAARLGGPDGRGAGNQQWSPDGRWLAFESRTAGGKADVFAMRADGTAMRQITTDPADDLAVSWSRDGRSIYFSSNRSGAWQIWKSDWETGREERVPTADGLGARESADGYLYYVRARRDSGFGRLWRMKLSTGEEEPMLDMTEICYACFLPFPDELYFLRHDERSGQAALFLQKFASGATHELARLGEGFACCIDMTADRRRFFYTRSEAKGYDLVRVENFR